MKVSPILEDIIHSPQLPRLVEELDAFVKSEAQRRLEFYEWMDDSMKVEFIDGEIVTHSPVILKHLVASNNLSQLLSTYVSVHDLGFVGVEKLLVKLTRNDFEPDISFFNAEKAKAFKGDTMFFPPPDFVVEILSKSTKKRDYGVKFIDYALHGVREYWIIDADKEIVEQYQNIENQFELLLKVNDGNIKSLAISSFEIPVRAIFDEQLKRETLKMLLND